MNNTEKYIYQVYLEKSFSKAAKMLFISQPSLSSVVARREEELGFRIFDRSTKPISLTPEGHVYIDMLTEMIESEKNMHLRIQKLSGGGHNSVSIGGSSSSVYHILPMICGTFYRRYPKIDAIIDLGNYSSQSSLFELVSHFQKLERGELDAVFCYEYDESRFEAAVMLEERMIVAMHKDFVTDELLPYVLTRDELLSGKYDPKKEIREKNFFRGVPFLFFSESSNTGKYMSELLGECSRSDYQILNSRHAVVHFNMMSEGVAALLTSDLVVAHSMPKTDICYFVFDKNVSTRKIYLVSKKGAALSSAARKFIEVSSSVANGAYM